MSAKSKCIECLFRLSGASKPSNPKKFYKKLRRNAIAHNRGENIASRVSGVRVEKNVYCGMVYYTFVPKHVETSACIMYLHGSGYMNPHVKQQEKFAALMAKSVHAKVYFPIYPKLPIATALPCHAVLHNFYRFLEKNGKICLVGDSSGAALCLILSEDKPEAQTIVAVSPWLDAGLKDVDKSLQKKDAFLCAEKLRLIAKLWAYDLPIESPKISPGAGNFEGKKILLFCGENEIFLPSVQAFCEKYKKNKSVRVDCLVGKNQPHDYPLLPTEEGAEARKILFETLVECLYGKTEEVGEKPAQ